MKLKRSRVGNVLLLFLALLAAFGVGEFITRLVIGDELVRFPRYHALAEYGDYQIRRLRPNTTFVHTSADGSWEFRINGQGFRSDHEFEYETRPGTIRVLVLGDSHTQGFEARQENTYSEVLRRHLMERGMSVEVINAGVSGFGSAEELVFLREEGHKYRPDYVVVGFFANDFQDNVKSDLFRFNDGVLVEQSQAHVPGVRVLAIHDAVPLLRWLNQRSYLYGLAINSFWEAAKRSRRPDNASSPEYSVPIGVTTRAKEQLGLAILEEMHRFAQLEEITLILVDIPWKGGAEPHSSVADSLVSRFRAASDVLITIEDLPLDSVPVDQIFAPHGQNHISETVHSLIGTAIGEWILGDRGRRGLVAVGALQP